MHSATDSRLLLLAAYFRFTLPATDDSSTSALLRDHPTESFPHLQKGGRLNPPPEPYIRRGHHFERDRSTVVVVVVTSREKSILPSAHWLTAAGRVQRALCHRYTHTALLTNTDAALLVHTRNLSTFLRSSSVRSSALCCAAFSVFGYWTSLRVFEWFSHSGVFQSFVTIFFLPSLQHTYHQNMLSILDFTPSIQRNRALLSITI